MIRITGGEYRGRMIHAPKGDRTRPTASQLRQALFNSIQMRIPEARVLDLFAGSGALGFEALSRGAAHATFVELAKPALRLIQENARELGCEDRAQLLGQSVEEFLRRAPESPYDVILADPPYEAGWELKILEKTDWQSFLSPGGVFCLEWGVLKSQVAELPESVSVLVKSREKKYGDSRLTTYIREA